MKYGIDISHWQGSIDFAKLNTDFVIMKLSQAQSKDSKFESYYNAYNGVKGCYIYNKVKTVEQARKEALYAVKCLNGRPMPLGVWLDLEDASMKRLGKAMLTEIVNAEASILVNAGYNVGIYCNKDWYVNVLDSKTLSRSFPFWIARYPSNDNGTAKEGLDPKNFNNCVMWQYSSKGKVNGINGNVDMDMMYKDEIKFGEIVQKSIDTLANEVLDGFWGSGTTRMLKLTEAGYDYRTVQNRVNELIRGNK